jgi:hypothetical protein
MKIVAAGLAGRTPAIQATTWAPPTSIASPPAAIATCLTLGARSARIEDLS